MQKKLQEKGDAYDEKMLEIANAMSEIGRLNEDVIRLKQELTVLVNNYDNAKSQLVDNEKMIQEKDDELERIRIEKSKAEEYYKREIENLQKKCALLESELKDDKLEENGIDVEGSVTIEDLRDKIRAVEIEKENIKKERDSYKKQFDDLRKECAEQESKISYYKNKYPEKVYLEEKLSDKTQNNNPDPVHNRKIDKVIDVDTGEEIDAESIFSKSDDELFHLRRELQDAIILDTPKYVCKYCGQMVKISGRYTERGKASFFSHLYDSAECDLKTTTGMSKAIINARKYGKFGESKRHKNLKNDIADMLRLENSVDMGVTDVQNEKVIFGSHPLFKWRRPDVYCKYKDVEIVFELQLSTTFVSVVAEREMFYKTRHVFVVWVFNFDDNKQFVDLRNMMMKDIYFENYRNVFIFDKEAKEESLSRKELVLKCDWLEPDGSWHYSKWDNDGIHGEFVSLSELKYNEATYKPYYHASGCEPRLINSQGNGESEKSLEKIMTLLDAKYEKIRKRQESEEERIKMVLDALDVDKIEKKYKNLEIAVVKKDDVYGLFRYTKGTEMLLLPVEYLSVKLLPTCRLYFLLENRNKRYQIYDAKNLELLKNEYNDIPKIKDDYAIASIKENCCDKFCVVSRFDHCLHESNSYELIDKARDNKLIITQRKNGAFFKGLISMQGAVLIRPEYTQLDYFSNKLFHAVRNGKHGIVDENGRNVLPFVYDEIDKLVDGKAKVFLGNSIGYVDAEGLPVFDKIVILNPKPVNHPQPEKRLFMNKWRLFNCRGIYLGSNENEFDEICHYQGHAIAFQENTIKVFDDVRVRKDRGVCAIFKEKTKTGLLFALGSRIVKMNKRQQRKASFLTYEVGKEYNLYVSCVNTDINMVYLSPIPCFGPTVRQYKKTSNHYSGKRR